MLAKWLNASIHDAAHARMRNAQKTQAQTTIITSALPAQETDKR